MLLYSANTQESLRRHIAECHAYNVVHSERLPDVAYTLAMHREHLPYRVFAMSGDRVTTSVSPLVKIPANVADIVMVFSGQGAQWPEMAKELIQLNKGFKANIEEMDRVLQSLEHPPTWRLKEQLQMPAETSQIHHAELAQPLCTAIQVRLVNALKRCGIKPKAVVGHSSGEIAAAYAAGAISMQAAMTISYYRGYVTKNQTFKGGMTAIGLSDLTFLNFFKTAWL